jgi:meso-butanediol dehydrogenase/(S,S)-butanediol dehydrogenase/diacetyl reductase
MGTLDGKVAIVTGASRGIGLATAERFLAEGARVTCASRGAPGNQNIEALDWIATDVTDTTSVQALVDQVLAREGHIDVLVNNAGVQIEKTLAETSDADWRQIAEVNMKGVFLAARAVIPVMARQGGGVILNIGSISADRADPAMALYNASKAFVHGLTRSIAVDHGKEGIRCCAIAPGWIMTAMATDAFALAADPEVAERAALTRHPVGRFGQPQDVAALATWLASDEAGFASGQVFTLDGTLTAASPIDPGGH